MAFTSLNGFLRTTDGRVFSWGIEGPCLGREVDLDNYNELAPISQPHDADENARLMDIGEIMFDD